MDTPSFLSKKKRMGFQEKPRTKEEIDREYTHHALMFGHINRMTAQNEKQAAEHLKALVSLAEEGLKLSQTETKTETQPESPEAS